MQTLAQAAGHGERRMTDTKHLLSVAALVHSSTLRCTPAGCISQVLKASRGKTRWVLL